MVILDLPRGYPFLEVCHIFGFLYELIWLVSQFGSVIIFNYDSEPFGSIVSNRAFSLFNNKDIEPFGSIVSHRALNYFNNNDVEPFGSIVSHCAL